MNCQQARRLLPLCIGNDLPDDADARDLQAHVAQCRECSHEQRQLQQSIEALQSASTALLPSGNTSLWPRLVSRLSDLPRRREQFNGWIPAVAMMAAASVMVAVSISQVRQEMGRTSAVIWQDDSVSSSDSLNELRNQRFGPGNVDQPNMPVRPMVVRVKGPPVSPMRDHQF
jgi:hypothetical protein